MSPRKVRLVADVVRQKPVDEAVSTLAHLHKKSADPIRKLIQSAVANAKNLDAVPSTQLVVEKIFVDEGPTMRRFRPRAFGRAFMIRKRTSKVTVVLQALEAKPKKSVKEASKTDSKKASTPSTKKVTSTSSKTSATKKTSTKTTK